MDPTSLADSPTHTVSCCRKKHEPYTCVRCGYQTSHKPTMRKHLYALKKVCPATIVDIEITDEIKDCIMKNRVYHIPKKPEPTINQTINNYNTMNNFISSMDTIDKLTKYISHKQIEMQSFEQSVEQRYQRTKKRLEADMGHYTLSQDDIYDIIDEISKVTDNNIADMNLLYDSKLNKLLVYESGDWKEMFVTSGMKSIIRIIQDYYWHTYEKYLIRKIKNRNNIPFSQRNDLKELLFEYYKFIACLDIDPFVKDKNNNQILYSSDDDRYWMDVPYTDIDQHSYTDEFMKDYTRIKNELKRYEIDSVKKQVLELIKTNSKKNICELNKSVISLFNVDEEFKNDLIISKVS